MAKLKILILESFYGGSHRFVADSIARHSRHDIDIVSLPARHWKWRMRASAFEFFRRVPDPRPYDLVFATSLTGAAELKGFWAASLPANAAWAETGHLNADLRQEASSGATSGRALPPILLYMHENQMDYPLSPGEKRDYHYGFSDIANCIAADRVLFNSDYHRNRFLGLMPDFLSRFPDYVPRWSQPLIEAKSEVLYPGVDVAGVDPPGRDISGRDTVSGPGGKAVLKNLATDRFSASSSAPMIIWNHRWEHDKGPEDFFEVLFRLADEAFGEGLHGEAAPFRLALLGERYRKFPDVFHRAEEKLASLIVCSGYIRSREEYLQTLSEASFVVSTAHQENFGISVVEAVRAGCRPLLPERLSYPELIPKEYHEEVLYEDREDLYTRLRALLSNPDTIPLPGLSEAMGRFDWPRRIRDFDKIFEESAR